MTRRLTARVKLHTGPWAGRISAFNTKTIVSTHTGATNTMTTLAMVRTTCLNSDVFVDES